MSTRNVRVNNRPVSVPAGALAGEVKQAALDAGIKPVVRRKGALILRGYLPSGGGIVLKDGDAIENYQPTGAQWKYTFKAFSLVEDAASNKIGTGRQAYWPARKGRMNEKQVRAAVGEPRMWPMPRVHIAPKFLRSLNLYNGPDWTVDESAKDIVRNQGGNQYDNYMTLTELQGKKLIAAMKEYVEQRRLRQAGKIDRLPWDANPEDALVTVVDSKQNPDIKSVYWGNFLCYIARQSRKWEPVLYNDGKKERFGFKTNAEVRAFLTGRIKEMPGPKGPVPQRPSCREQPTQPRPPYQEAKDPDDTRTVKLSLQTQRAVFQPVDITKTLTPHGLARLVVIHRDPKKLRVFWHPGFAKDKYQVAGVTVPLVKQARGKFWEGAPTAAQWKKLGVTT